MGHLRVRRILLGAVFVLFCIAQSQAATFGDVRGIVFDPQHHAIAGATIRLHSRSSDFSQTMQSNSSGEFLFRAIPIGEYTVTIESTGFKSLEQPVTVISGNAPVLHFYLAIAPVSQSVPVPMSRMSEPIFHRLVAIARSAPCAATKTSSVACAWK